MKQFDDITEIAMRLLAAGLNDVLPLDETVEEMMDKDTSLQVLKWCSSRGVAGVVATVLERYGDARHRSAPEERLSWREWDLQRGRIVRKNTMFEIERAEIFRWMDEQGIWHVPLKGAVLDRLYPRVGMREMVDNDILFDDSYADQLNEYMISRGYEGHHIGDHHDDGYTKDPVYNFEMHRSSAMPVLTARLDENHNLSDEAFYAYLVQHAYGHYREFGVGIRILADLYIFNKAKPNMDRATIRRFFEEDGTAVFGEQFERLSNKIFDITTVTEGISEFSSEDIELFKFMLKSGILGSYGNRVLIKLNEMEGKDVVSSPEDLLSMQRKFGLREKTRFMIRRALPPFEKMQREFGATRLTLPYWYVYRLITMRKYVSIEIDKIKKL